MYKLFIWNLQSQPLTHNPELLEGVSPHWSLSSCQRYSQTI